MTTLRFAVTGFLGASADAYSGLSRPIPVLASYAYIDKWDREIRPHLQITDWSMDSGAYSAYAVGATIDLQQYTDVCAQRLEQDKQLCEVFALDVIGDWEAGARNAEEMTRQGVPCIPCYHYGEPEAVLLEYAAKYPKIALGGMVEANGTSVNRRKKLKWAAQCFARVWPKRIHGFGLGSREQLLALPWHSVDASNFASGPSRFAKWRSYGSDDQQWLHMSVRGKAMQVQPEIEYYLRLQDLARHKWRAALQECEERAPLSGAQ